MFAVVDMEISNISSVCHALDRVGVPWRLAKNPDKLDHAAGIILPGVGAFPDGMASLEAKGLVEPLRRIARDGRCPILGICLGLQLMADEGEEHGITPGLGLIPGRVERLIPESGERVPHIGWCPVEVRPESRLMGSVAADECFYFVHSFHLRCANPAHMAATVAFGGGQVTAAVEAGLLFGAQFHPEKSQDVGMELFARFSRLAGMAN